MEILRSNYERLKEEEEKCYTFRPQIQTKYDLNDESRDISELGRRPETARVNVVERTKIWAETRQRRIENLKEGIVDKDIKECTFQPNAGKKQISHLRQPSLD